MMVGHCFYIHFIGNLPGCSVDDSEDWQVHLLTIGSGWMRKWGKKWKEGLQGVSSSEFREIPDSSLMRHSRLYYLTVLGAMNLA